QVHPVYESFTKKYGTPLEFLKDKNPNVLTHLGLRWREATLRKLAEAIVHKDIPGEKDELLKLPGIGDYISAAYRSLHLGVRDVIIDSNIVRLYGRYFGFPTDGETRRKKWFILLADRITPEKHFKEFNYALIDFTRTICKPKPIHEDCILREQCSLYKETKNVNC
ncbi:hypothetical protein WD019_21005, partial [Fictibacillus sp. Mic-4]|uniref:hypothetical protein n=1 Tax=Fictibacillus sp. Mic-4 TaxID=3132826 RepID=UPI003CED0F24